MFDAAKELCASSDLIVRHIFCYPTQLAAELANKPVATLYPVHNITPNPYQAPFGAVNFGNWAIPLWWKLAQWLINKIFLKQINDLRNKYDRRLISDVLTEAWSNETLNLIAVSNAICPSTVKWPNNFLVSGFLNLSELSENENLSIEITDFLDNKDPPVYFTFGSMLVPDEASWRFVYETWRDTVNKLGCRAIFQLPLPESVCLTSDPNILILRRAPHNLVFPFCKVIVHHGGAGTTQSSLLAGCPSIVVAHIADQPFWGSELMRLGVSPGYIQKNEMTSSRLYKLLAATFKNNRYRDNALHIAKLMHTENGVDKAIKALLNITR
jgi:UDP:flavonoid glycosyltransferase YjiC (YdhE family)